MSFGFSVGDVVALTQLAWKTYKACKDAPASFANLVQETQSLHAILHETEEVLTDSHTRLTPAQQRRLQSVTDGCRGVLSDLDALLQKYESLNTQSKISWDRMGYATRDIAELRSRLTTHTLLLSSFIQTSQVVVEQKLRKLIREVQEGKLEGSQISVNTLDSLNVDERKRWRTIRKQLEGVGITMAAFEENSTFIIDYMRNAIVSGDLEEKPRDLTPSASPIPPEIQTSAAKQNLSKEQIRPGKFTLPTPTLKRFSGAWRRSAPVTVAPVIQEPRWSQDHKILMLGISEAGKSTVLNQTRLLSSPSYSQEEYNNCRMYLWNRLIGDFVLVLDELPYKSHRNHYRAVVKSAIETMYKASLLEHGDEPFPVLVMDALDTLWGEPTVRKVLDRGPELGLSDNMEYFYKSMRRIADPGDQPSNDDVLNIRIRTLGIAETSISFDREIFRIFDVPGERIGRNKWIHCMQGEQARCVTFVASLTSYCSFVEDITLGANQLDESLRVFESIVASTWFPESIFVLYLTKLDIFQKSMRQYPIEDYDPEFPYRSSKKRAVTHGLAFIANKFVALAKTHNRILQVHCINATSPSSQECLKGTLRFISYTVPSRPANGTGRLMPCPHCQMGDLFSLDHFETPAEPFDFGFSDREDDDNDVVSNTDSPELQSTGEARETSEDEYDPADMMPPQPLGWHNISVFEEVVVEPH